VLSEALVPGGPIATVRQALESGQSKARGLVVEQEHAALGMVRTVAQPLALTATPPSYRRPPPAVGEHNHEILAELGLDTQAIEDLARSGVMGAA
jgi:formyl-CoA transferase